MWERLKALFGGWSWRPSGELDEAPADVASEAPRAPAPRPRHVERDRVLAAVDRALGAGRTAEARELLGPLLLDETPDPPVFAAAARLMDRVLEPGLAEGFRGAATSTAPEPVAELSAAFLSMDDAPMGAALARVALARAGGGEALLVGLLAEATARLGHHDEVVALLSPYEGAWPDPALARRYALSVVLAGDVARIQGLGDALAGDTAAGWILGASRRALDGPAGDLGTPRHALYIEYGAALVDAREVRVGGRLTAGELARIVEHVAGTLEESGAHRERVAYATNRGEVLARWVAAALDTTAIPLAARLQGQQIAVVAADDDDLAHVVEHPGMAEGPVALVQVVKDPRVTGVPAADVYGVLGADTRLPLEALVAQRAVDRTPPRLLLAELVAAAKAAPAPDPWPGRAAWIRERARWLCLVSPAEPDQRVPWIADLPAAALAARPDPPAAEAPEPAHAEGEAAAPAGVPASVEPAAEEEPPALPEDAVAPPPKGAPAVDDEADQNRQ